MRSVLDDERYDAVREALSESREGSLAKYRFEKPVVPADAASAEMDVEGEGQAQVAKKVKRAHGGRGGGRGGRGGRGRGRR